MTSVAIIGASGVVGSSVLRQLLARDDVSRIIALGRRPGPVQHDKLTWSVVDLQDIEALAAALPDGLAVAISAIGTTIKNAGSREAFRAIDHDAVLAFARAARRRGAQRFAVVSGLGANPRSSNFYLRTKGEMEQALAGVGFPQLVILQPSLIDDQGARTEHRVGERLALPVARAVFSVIGRRHRYAPIAADVIARALVRVVFDNVDERVRTIESDRLHELGA